MKFNKKMIMHFAAFLFFSIMIPMISLAQTVTLGTETNAQIGEEVLVPLNFENIDGAAVIKLYFTYKTDVLTWNQGGYTNVIPELSSVLINAVPDTVPGQNILVVQWFSLSSPVNFPDGKVLDFEFTYLEGETDLGFTSLTKIQDGSLNTIAVTYISGSVSGQTGSLNSTWNGTGNWSEEQYWSNGIPGFETAAIIESGVCSVNTGALCNSLTISESAVLNITPGNFLTVNEDVSIAGELNILSDATGTGSFINKGNLINNGSLNVQRFIDANYLHFVSSPVLNIASSLFTNAEIGLYGEETGEWQPLNSTDLLEGGKGYLINASETGTYTLSGNIYTGDIASPGIQYTSGGGNENWPAGLNLAGNPYTSAIAWNLGGWTKLNINGSIYVWNEDNYLVWNGEIGNLTDGIIPAMQGFFVVANDNNPQLTIPADARIHSTQSFYKTDDNKGEYLVLALHQGGKTDQIFVQFEEAATDEFDNAYDAYKLPGSDLAPQLYSIASGDIKLSINAFPKDKTKIVDLGYVAGVAGNDFQMEYIKTYTYYDTLYLLDTETYARIYLNEDSVYTFTSEQGTFNSRFKIYFTKVTGIDELANHNISLYSYENTLFFSSDEFIKQARLDVIDLQGRRLKSFEVSDANTGQFKLTGINGLCIIRYISGSYSYSKKIWITQP
jgi:hypothetical protein